MNDSKAFIEYSNDMDDIYKKIEEHNPDNKCKILLDFDDMIADMLCYKNLNLRVTELYIWGRKVNISLVFITQSYFAAPKNIRLNSAHYFIMKIPNKWELQQIAFLPIHQVLTLKTLWVFIKMYCKTIFFLITDTTLALDKFQENWWQD